MAAGEDSDDGFELITNGDGSTEFVFDDRGGGQVATEEELAVAGGEAGYPHSPLS